MAKPDLYKNQHLIPRSYLEGWCDPNAPTNYEPYLWRIKLADGSKFRRCPEKTFAQNNRYTIVLPNGERDLTMEKTLGQTEGDFIATRELIMAGKCLELADKAALCIFAGAMATRSERQGEHWRRQMQGFLEQSRRFEKKSNLILIEHPTGGIWLRMNSCLHRKNWKKLLKKHTSKLLNKDYL